MLGIRIGGVTVTGGPAVLVVAVVVGFLLALIGPFIPGVSLESEFWVSAMMWTYFFFYWTESAQDVALTKSSESKESRKFHTNLLAASFILLFLPIPGLRYEWLSRSLAGVSIGLAIQAASLWLAISARRTLGANWSGAITEVANHALIRSGPYRLIRHPIYAAMIGMFAGTAIWTGTMHGVLATLVLSGAYLRKIPLEEANLRRVFGAEYETYVANSWALLPGVY